jgi:fumarate hydratase subunit alpha
VAELCLKANYQARPDARYLLEKSLEDDNSPAAVMVLEQLLANIDTAAGESLPLCQDCGYVTVFVELGQEVSFDGPFNEAVQAGVSRAHSQGYLRRSVIRDALSGRTEPEEDRPAAVHIDLKPGDGFGLTVFPKGGGSDNAGKMAMLKPTTQLDGIVEFIVEAVAGSCVNACPPVFVGVGIGGSFDSVALLAKKALLRDFREAATDVDIAALERRLLEEINDLGAGPGGLGGRTTALGVAVNTDRAHIACLPVAVNLSCNQLRSASGTI